MDVPLCLVFIGGLLKIVAKPTEHPKNRPADSQTIPVMISAPKIKKTSAHSEGPHYNIFSGYRFGRFQQCTQEYICAMCQSNSISSGGLLYFLRNAINNDERIFYEIPLNSTFKKFFFAVNRTAQRIR